MVIGASGFIQLRRGLDQHVREGRISFFEASLYVFVLLNTNPSTGLCHGSAGLFSAIYGLSSRTCRDALEKLESKGYLKRFPTRGKHGSYPILVNKFLCSHGAMKGMYVNSFKSNTYSDIFYESRDDDGDDVVNESVNESAGSKKQDTREKKQEIKAKAKSLPKDKPSVDERFGLFKLDFEKNFRYQNRADAPWDAKEASRLSGWLKANPKITQDQWRNILRHRRVSPVSRGAPLSSWIGKALSWLSESADEWGKPINTNGSGGKHAAVSLGKTEGNMAILNDSLFGAEHKNPADEDGVFSAGEDGEDDSGTIHGVFTPIGSSSVSGGDGDDF